MTCHHVTLPGGGRAHAQMMAIFAALGIPVSTAVVIDKDGVRVSLPVPPTEQEQS